MDYSNAWIFMPLPDYVEDIRSYHTTKEQSGIMLQRLNDLVVGTRRHSNHTLVAHTCADGAGFEVFKDMEPLWPGHRPCRNMRDFAWEMHAKYKRRMPCQGMTIFSRDDLGSSLVTDLEGTFDWFMPRTIFIVSWKWWSRLAAEGGQYMTYTKFDPTIQTGVRRWVLSSPSSPPHVVDYMVQHSHGWLTGQWESPR